MHKSLADPIGKAFFMGDNCTLSCVFVIFFFFLRDNSISEKESFFLEAGLAYYVVRGSAIANNRAYAALEHACQQYPENDVYTGVVRIDTHANYFPPKFGEFCGISRPLISVTLDG